MNLWVYPTGAGQIVSVCGSTTINAGYHYTAIEITAGGLIYFGQWTGAMTTIATSQQALNRWYNLVITYNGTTATAYVNGTSVGSSAIAWSSPGASTFFALMANDSTSMTATSAYASGSIGIFMAYNRGLSAAEVTQNYNATCKRYGLAAITSTQMPVVRRELSSGTLLVNSGGFDEVTITPITNGLAQRISTTGTHYVSGYYDEVSMTAGSASFNGSTQYFNATIAALGTSDFTVECWFNATSFAAENPLFKIYTSGTNNLEIRIPSGTLTALYNSGTATITGTALSTSTWYHVALVRSTNTLTMYLNGVSNGTSATITGSTMTSPTFYLARNQSGSAWFTGSISNFRIVSSALYTANFTPPRSVLDPTSTTLILLRTMKSSNFATDSGPSALTITNNGGVTFNSVGPFA
jgi:hypothetical protein